MNRLFILFLLSWIAFSSFAQEKRNLLVNEAKEIGIESVLVKNFSEIDFPTYKSRDFWDGLPTDLKKQYVQEAEAAVKKWVRGYRLDRDKKFTITDTWELAEIKEQPTSLNLITYCKVTEAGPGVLNLQGDGFELTMKYNAKVVSPKIEFNEVTDTGLKRYWPDGITRIVFEIKNPKLKGNNSVTVSK